MMNDQYPKSYTPEEAESAWYTFWEKNDFFKPSFSKEKKPYSIVIPPPNVTGVLHMGHALVNTLQDILIRWKRMLGFDVLWVPGTDHAGIATQTVVEQHLIKTEGKRRKDYSREEFLSHVWRWKEQNESRILNQLKALGCSCDWSKLRFTMDEKSNLAVRTVFKKLYDEGLIYRGDYLVNWDPVTQTALADDEVEYEEKEGFLWYFKYPLEDKSGFITIATTRPETMLGDTAIAVSPDDERYKDVIGKHVILPLVERKIPIIADRHVDPSFGTGAVKVTPAHDPNDYEIGHRHNLPFINILQPNGKINENGQVFQGLSKEEAREKIIAKMKELNLLEKVEKHLHRVGISYRSKAVIEPYISKQWFVKMSAFKKMMREVVEKDHVKIIPENWKNTYFHWIDNLRDWCISRQLWWGHRIPVWYHKDNVERMICYSGEGVPEEVQREPEKWYQDEDVLDTWFSSALWPFSALGWPDETEIFKRFYPTSTLVTGHDILFFWVARMIMMGNFVTHKNPFSEVFLHGLIFAKSYWKEDKEGNIAYIRGKERDEYDLGKPIPKGVKSKWEKMSKSKGNILDPLEICKEYGTDAMRMALCASSPEQRQIELDRRRIEEFRNFSNKIWNGARFVIMNLDLSKEEFASGLDFSSLLLEDRWILSVLDTTVQKVNTYLTRYSFDQAALLAYDFFWKEFCAYYVEISKPFLFKKVGNDQERLNKQKILTIVLSQSLRLIHPMAPFITEDIFQRLKEKLKDVKKLSDVDIYTQEAVLAFQSAACMVAPYPAPLAEKLFDKSVLNDFTFIEKVVYTIRNIRGEMNIPINTPTHVYFICDNATEEKLQKNVHIIKALVKVESLHFSNENIDIGFASTGVLDQLKIMVPLPKELMEKEKRRLEKEKVKLESSLETLKRQLENKNFIEKAPKALIEEKRKLQEQTKVKLDEVQAKILEFSS